MDMKFAIEFVKQNHSRSLLDDAINNNALSYDEYTELFKLAGMPDDAAEFLAEWYPELAHGAVDNVWYTYGFDHSLQWMNEQGLVEYMQFLEVSEDEYQDNYGIVIRDAAFDGVIVCGE